MAATATVWMLVAALALGGCGSSEPDPPPEPEPPPMKVEDTVFGDLISTQDKARDRTNQAVDTHREALNQRLESDEGAPPEDAPPEE